MGNALFDLPAYPLRFEYLPAPLVVVLFLLLAWPIVWLGRTTIGWQGTARGWTVIGVRLAAVWVIVLLLAGTRWERPNRDLEVIFLRDVSLSTAAVAHPIDRTLIDVENEYLKAICERKPRGDRIGVIRFDDRAALETLPHSRLRGDAGVRWKDGSGTNIACAIQLGLAGFTGDAMRRLVLLADGNVTQGETDAAVAAASAAGVTIDVMPLHYAIKQEVMVERLIAPAHRREGAPFTLEAVVRSTHETPVTMRMTIADAGRPIDLDPQAGGLQEHIDLLVKPGVTPVRIKVPSAKAGVHQFAAWLEPPRGCDELAGNNVAEAIMFVRGGMRVLYVDGVGGGGGKVLPDVLSASGMVIEERDHMPPHAMPGDAADLQEYDAIVLANVARGDGGLSQQQERAIVQYVRDFGGGLVVVGGPNALGAGHWQGSELEKALPVNTRPSDRRVVPAGALVIVMDRSGSMGDSLAGRGTKHRAALAAATAAIQSLRRTDHVGVVAFDQSPTWVVPLERNNRPEHSAAALAALAPGGGTSIYPALEQAHRALAQMRDVKLRHVLLMTDGVSAPGDFENLIRKMTAAGITLSTVAVGGDADGQLLAQFARLGGGTHYGVADAQRLCDVFVREGQSISRPFVHEPANGIAVFGDLALTHALPSFAGAAFPRLGGIVLTSPKPAAEVLLRTSGDGDVVLARNSYGLGHVAVFAGDASPRWAAKWIASRTFARFWPDVVRAAARRPSDESVQTTIVRDGPKTKLIVETADGDGRATNRLAIAGKLRTPAPGGDAADVKLVQSGPGTYETTLETCEPGAYFATMSVIGKSGAAGAITVGFCVASSQELRDLTSNEEVLSQIATRTGGRVLRPLDRSADLFTREGVHASASSHPITDLLICTLLSILLIDVGVRRIAWDWAAAKGLLLAGAEQVRAFCTMRPCESAAMLATLRRVRKDVVEQRFNNRPVAEDMIGLTVAAESSKIEPHGGNLWEAKRRARQIIAEQERN